MEPAVERAFTAERRREAAATFGLRVADLVELDAFECYVFRFEQAGRAAVLRVTHRSHRSREALEAEVDWVSFLRQQGLDVCGPLRSPRGNWVESIGDDIAEFFVNAFELAPGRPATAQDWGAELFENWGRFLGKSHRLTREYRPAPGRPRRSSWHEDPYHVRALELIPQEETAIRERYLEHIRALKELPQDNDCFGLCHTDLHPGNFHVDRGRIHAFDTDDCAYHWFIEDVSSALYYSWRGPAHTNQSKSRLEHAQEFLPSFWRGYQSEYQLDNLWLDELPRFLNGRVLTLYVVLNLKWDLTQLTSEQAATLGSFRERLTLGAPWVELDAQRKVARGEAFAELDYRALLS